MDAAEWLDIINDDIAGWASIFMNRSVPVPVPATTQAVIAIEQSRQQQQTLLLLGLAAVLAYAATR